MGVCGDGGQREQWVGESGGHRVEVRFGVAEGGREEFKFLLRFEGRSIISDVMLFRYSLFRYLLFRYFLI